MRFFKESLLSRYADASFILQQKIYILHWILVVVIVLLAVISILNLTTAVSSHPVLITGANLLLIGASIASLYLLYNGRYDLAAFFAIAAVTLRVLAGTYIKLDLFASGQSNDNIYFMFSVKTVFSLMSSSLCSRWKVVISFCLTDSRLAMGMQRVILPTARSMSIS